MNRNRILIVAVAVMGCGNSRSSSEEGATPSAACAVNRNDEIRQLLAPTCEGCHGPTSNHPFFASARAFEDLLVYEPRYVTPGKPEESRLVALLEGRAEGTYTQMPPGKPLGEREAARISVAAIKEWIKALPPPGPEVASPDRAAATVRRLTAEEMVTTLRRLLGLKESDLRMSTDVLLPLRAPDTAWGAEDPGSTHGAMARFEALGGASTIEYRAREHDFTPAAAQVLVQLSLEWCGRAVELKSNPALFKHATVDEKEPAAIKRNIAYLHLRFLGIAPTEAAISAIHTGVYEKYSSASTATAWTAVCAYFVRHPQTLTL